MLTGGNIFKDNFTIFISYPSSWLAIKKDFNMLEWFLVFAKKLKFYSKPF